MSDDQFADRKKLTFEQAEGAEPIPTQLRLKEVSEELRAVLWMVVYESTKKNTEYPSMGGHSHLVGEWKAIFYLKHVLRDHRMADDFENRASKLIGELKLIFSKGDYIELFGFLQYLLRHQNCPYGLPEAIQRALVHARSAYRIIDRDTIVPIGSEQENETLTRAFSDLDKQEFNGARTHLKRAAFELTAGKFADSIRESIHSVESVVRVLAPSGRFAEALAKLDNSVGIHGGLKAGFNSIYGFTSDEEGLRHPLLDEPKSAVDECDALFMIGACAAFVSYLIGKSKLIK